MKKKPQLRLAYKLGIKIFLLCIPVCFLSLLIYSIYLSNGIESRFSGRRWQIPSKVYSDTTVLYTGQHIPKGFFSEKLKNLNYHEVEDNRQFQKGQIRTSPEAVDIFLYDFNFSFKKRVGFPVRIRLYNNKIQSIVRMDKKIFMPVLELEPEEIMQFFGTKRERRQLVSINKIPKHVLFAILAAEDKSFYSHFGIDPLGIIRATFKNIAHGRLSQGGSTITQQLSKNYFLTHKRTISRKLKEILISLIIEFMYEKDEIFEIYLNEIYLGQKGSESINGILEASFFYFGKSVTSLLLPEAAAIAGLIKAPNYYSPYVNKKRCKKRRDMVIRAMSHNGWVSENLAKKAVNYPVKPAGCTVYERKAPYFIDYLSNQLHKFYSPKDLSSLGLTIYTTLDIQVQRAAQKALKKGLNRLEKENPLFLNNKYKDKLQGAIVVLSPKTGYILAMVGGKNYGTSQFNRITDAKRQPGSAFKPFVYLAGLNKLTPATLLSNRKKTIIVNGKAWSPENFSRKYSDKVTMRVALAKSLNLPTVDLAFKTGLEKIIEKINLFEFSTEFKSFPSLSLGAFEVIPLELARAYCVFAADGVLPYPMPFKNVLDENGKIIKRRYMDIKQVISSAKAFIISSMLKSVITDGTGSLLKKKGVVFPVAGKTGTSNNYKDAWFIGYTPDILALVWIGFDKAYPINATGGTAALPIWADLIKFIPQYISGTWFKIPSKVVKKNICNLSKQVAGKNCPDYFEEFFLDTNFPKKCTVHDKYK